MANLTWYHSLSLGLDVLVHLFRGVPLKSLSVSGDHDTVMFDRRFRVFPTLKILTPVGGCGARAPPSRSSPEPDGADLATDGSAFAELAVGMGSAR